MPGTPPELELEWAGNTLHIRGRLNFATATCLGPEVERAGDALDFELTQLEFVDEDGAFRVEDFNHAVDLMVLALEIMIGFARYPTGRSSPRLRYRQ